MLGLATAGRRRGDGGGPRPAAGPAHRGAGCTSATSPPGARSSWSGRPRSAGSVTAEAAPHHFSLTDEAARSYDPVFKVNPPLREKADVEAVRLGLADGTLDAIATDHAPHAREDKEVEWASAPRACSVWRPPWP